MNKKKIEQLSEDKTSLSDNICRQCGKILTNLQDKFCSKKCTSLSRRKRFHVNCSFCNKTIERQNYEERSTNYYCNEECRKKYSLAYNNSHKKDRILKVKGKKCERCGITDKPLDLHHVIYEYGKDNNPKNYMILCRSCHHKLHYSLKKQEKGFIGVSAIQRCVVDILSALKIPLDDENFRNTPQRVSRMYLEMFEGLYAQEEIDNILSTSFPTEYKGMVVSQDIVVWSMCPHHLLPVRYTINVGIIFKDDCIGLSKIPRFVKLLAKRPVLQETLNSDIVTILSEKLKAEGVICTISGMHTCMQARGAEVKDTSVITSFVSGCFEKNSENCKGEFFKLLEL